MKRRIFNIPAALSLVLCIAAAALWVRSQWRTDALTFVVGSTFLEGAAGPDGISIAWLTGLPATDMPSSTSRGWRTCASGVQTFWERGRRVRPDGPFINVPDATLQSLRFSGIEVSQGSGQILQPVWLMYKATPLMPLRRTSTSWGALVTCAAIAPGVPLVLSVRRRWMRRRRGQRGLCPECGYDLRASKERCPECGTEVRMAEGCREV